MADSMSRTWISASTLAASLFVAHIAAAELLGSAARINVNETTAVRAPNAASNGTTRTLLVYRGSTATYDGIIGQFFDLAGSAVTGEFVAMDYPINTPFEQAYGIRKPVGGVDAAGNGVVAWEAGDVLSQPDGSCTAIYAQRIDATGARVGSPFQVNTTTFGCQVAPQLAVQPDGSFLIAWGHANGSNAGIFARHYDAAGAPQGNDFRVGGAVNADDANPALAIDGSGDYALAWNSLNGLLFHRITATGTAVTPEVTVAGVSGRPSLAADLATGAVLVAWQKLTAQDGHTIMARHYDATGAASGAEFRVNALPMMDGVDEENLAINGEPVVVTLGGGQFVVLWADQSDPHDAYLDLFASIIASPGTMVRGNFVFAARSIWGDPVDARPTAVADGAGGARLFWEHAYPTPVGSPWQSTFLRGVYTQRFGEFCPPTPMASCLTSAKGSIALKKGGDVSEDTLTWKWLLGTVAAADFGDPTTSTTFGLCVYDGTGALVIAATAPGGSACKKGKPCWSLKGAAPAVQFKYTNTVKPSLPGGIKGIKLKSGTGGASILVKGRGLNLYSVPTLPLDQSAPVRVQLINDTNAVCWEGTYSAPATSGPLQFKDKVD